MGVDVQESAVGNTEDDRGVVYLFCGIGFAERIVVSLTTLRDHWEGPVTVMCTDEECEGIIQRMPPEMQIKTRRVEKMTGKRSHYLTKPLVPTWTPYQRTVFIDADTTIVGTFDEMFAPTLALTQFGDWVSLGRRMSGRIILWKGLSNRIDELVRQQLATEHKAINTGTFGFHKGYVRLAEWYQITQAGVGKMMTDELAMQVLHGDLPECQVLDDRFNCSPLYGATKDDEVRIWHFHGSKHIRRDRGKVLWWPAFERTYRQNVAGIREWAGRFDKKQVGAQLKKTPVAV